MRWGRREKKREDERRIRERRKEEKRSENKRRGKKRGEKTREEEKRRERKRRGRRERKKEKWGRGGGEAPPPRDNHMNENRRRETKNCIFWFLIFGWGFGRFRLRWGDPMGQITSTNASFGLFLFWGFVFVFFVLVWVLGGLGWGGARRAPSHLTLPLFGFVLFLIFGCFLLAFCLLQGDQERPNFCDFADIFSQKSFLQMLLFLACSSSASSSYSYYEYSSCYYVSSAFCLYYFLLIPIIIHRLLLICLFSSLSIFHLLSCPSSFSCFSFFCRSIVLSSLASCCLGFLAF